MQKHLLNIKTKGIHFTTEQVSFKLQKEVKYHGEIISKGGRRTLGTIIAESI